jgi:hypothetical protein
MAGQYNPNNPSVKRIMIEIKEMEKETTTQFRAKPLEVSKFEGWFSSSG